MKPLRGLYSSWLGLGWLAAVAAAAAANATPDAKAPAIELPPEQAQLAPALKAAAEKAGIDLFVREPVVAGTAPAVGDSVVAWVKASDGHANRQWLVQLRRAVATADEIKAAEGRIQTRYLSWGPILTFKSQVEALDIWVAGPVPAAVPAGAAARPAPTQRVRVCLPGDYLRLGLDESARVQMHMVKRAGELKKAEPGFAMGHIYSLGTPIKPENMAYAKPVAEKLGLTPEMGRAWLGGLVALQAFYEAANGVPALRAIAAITTDKPSLFKLATLLTGNKFNIVTGDAQRIDPAALNLLPVTSECFNLSFAMRLSDDPVTVGALAVTAPTPPLDVSAGILGVLSVHPTDRKRIVELQLIAMQHGPAPGGGGHPEAGKP